MARVFVERHGRAVRFRNRPTRHNCGKRKFGQPGRGYGACYHWQRSRVRRDRRAARLAAAAALGARSDT